jgi:hypothetical protein
MHDSRKRTGGMMSFTKVLNNILRHEKNIELYLKIL